MSSVEPAAPAEPAKPQEIHVKLTPTPVTETSLGPNMKTIELEISLEIRKALENKQLSPTSALAIVRKGTELLATYNILKGAEKKALLVRVLEHISAGNDGILGTDDDLLPESTVKAIRALLDETLLDDVVQTFVGMLKGDIQPAKLASLGMRLKDIGMGLFQCFSGKKNKVKP